jgi:hypothetical protein
MAQGKLKDRSRGGRPLKFATPQILQEKINAYFEKCKGTMLEKTSGKDYVVTVEEPPTLAGLAYFLDCDSETITNYEERDGFFEVVRRAKEYIQWKQQVGGLVGQLDAGLVKFAAERQFGWKSLSKIEVESKSDQAVNEILSKLGFDSLDDLAEKIVELSDKEATHK